MEQGAGGNRGWVIVKGLLLLLLMLLCMAIPASESNLDSSIATVNEK